MSKEDSCVFAEWNLPTDGQVALGLLLRNRVEEPEYPGDIVEGDLGPLLVYPNRIIRESYKTSPQAMGDTGWCVNDFIELSEEDLRELFRNAQAGSTTFMGGEGIHKRMEVTWDIGEKEPDVPMDESKVDVKFVLWLAEDKKSACLTVSDGNKQYAEIERSIE